MTSDSLERILRLTLPVLLAFVALPTIGADGLDEIEALVAHQQFGATAPYQNAPDQGAAEAVGEVCQTLDRRCIAFASEHTDVVLASVPDNPEFWSAYAGLLAADPLPIEHIEPNDLAAISGVMNATQGWLRRELVTNGISDAMRLQAQVTAHRRRLASSSLLLDKMVFIATTSMVLAAINVHMAHRGLPTTASDRRMLDDMVKPLTRDELSLRRAMHGELRYIAARLKELPEEDSPVQVDELEHVYRFVADRSEAGWEEFWRRGLDALANVEAPSESYVTLPNWGNYAANVRYLDASLYVLRALREVYEGRVSPGPPATRAPYGWSWRWEEESQTLCLTRGYVHESVSLEESVNICHQHLEPSNPWARS